MCPSDRGKATGRWRRTVGVEIEPEWASMHRNTLQGDAPNLPFKDHTFDCIATSPTYGNRFADSHVARDDSERRSWGGVSELDSREEVSWQCAGISRGRGWRVLMAASVEFLMSTTR